MPDLAHTVIVPAYNAAGTLESAIRSVRSQTDSSFELIAVDDGSTDATPDLLQRLAGEDARIRVIRQENAGPSAAREAAMGQASGTYLTFLDSDDLLMPSYLETMAKTLGADAEIGLAYARGWVLDDAVGGGRVRRAVWPQPGNVTDSDADPSDPVVALASGNYIGAVQTARRHAVVRAGGLDAGLDQAEDYDLWLRIAIAGFRIVSAPGTLVIVRNRADSLSKDQIELARGVRDVCERILSVYDVSDEARAAAGRQLERANREIDLLSGRTRVRGALRRVRLALGRAKRRLLAGRIWYPVPPPEVAEAFPELVRRSAIDP